VYWRHSPVGDCAVRACCIGGLCLLGAVFFIFLMPRDSDRYSLDHLLRRA
jgi:hypothetical protein